MRTIFACGATTSDLLMSMMPLTIINDSNHRNGGMGIEFNDKSIEVEQGSASWDSVSSRDEERTHGKCIGRLRSSNSIEFDDIKRYFYICSNNAIGEGTEGWINCVEEEVQTAESWGYQGGLTGK